MSAQARLMIFLLAGLAAGCGDGGSGQPAAMAATNAAPVIAAGSLETVTQTGTRYSFVPEAYDPENEPLVFSIRNKPAWAGFNTLTGELSGTPLERDVGLTHGVEISASDGQSTTVLPSFNLEVVYAGTRNVTLSWTPPDANKDGTPLIDLAGFRIYYGNRHGEFPFVIEVENPGLTSFVVENLSPGTYFFATTALDGYGNESALSQVIEVSL